MTDGARLGGKVRALRRAHQLTQARLAEQLGVSASYLNLIEHNRRPLPASMLIALARKFDVDLASFADDDGPRLERELLEVFGDEVFEGSGVTPSDVADLVGQQPNVARAVRDLYEALVGAREQARALAAGAGDAPQGRSILPSEEVSDFIQGRMNWFPDLEAAAEALIRDEGLVANDMQSGLVRVLEQRFGFRVRFVHAGDLRGAVRRLDRRLRSLEVSEVLPPRSRNFQLAHTIGLLSASSLVDRLVQDPSLSTDASRALARVALANYFAGAVLMPYEDFLVAAEEERYDIELLGHRFRVSFEQVCHRLTTLRRPGREGVPFHLIRIDVAGNISKRFSASGIQFARYSGACPRWNVFGALLAPGTIRLQLSTMPSGETYFCLARAIRKGDRGFHATHTVHAVGLGCLVEHAHQLVYADGMDLRLDRAVPIGVSCRLCPRGDCEQRAMPAVGTPMRIDEDVRGTSFYASPDRH